MKIIEHSSFHCSTGLFRNYYLIVAVSLWLYLSPIIVIGEIVEPKKPGKVDGLIAKVATHVLAKRHYLQRHMDNEISGQLFESYFNTLDPGRFYFYASDIDAFAYYKNLLDEMLNKGQIDFAYDVYTLFLERIAERLAYAKERLEMPFDLSKDDEFIPDREDFPWCSDMAELNKIWSLRIKNDILNHLLSNKNKNKKKTGKNLHHDPTQKNESVTAKKDGLGLSPELDLSIESSKEHILNAYDNYYKRIKDKSSLEILEIFLSALARIYDPHSAYLAPITKENFDISMKHELEGIGARLMSDQGYAKITEIIIGGPADRDRQLKAGDVIISVAQENKEPVDILDMNLSRVVSLIRGPKGTRVILGVVEAGKDLSSPKKTVELVRDKVNLVDRGATINYLTAPPEPPDSLNEAIGLESKSLEVQKIGVISLRSFYSDFEKRNRGAKQYTSSTQDVLKLIKEAKEQKISGLIMDLRANSGGSLDEAVSLVGLFFDEGPVVQVGYWNGKKTVLKDKDPIIYYDGPLIVLVDKFSASATEIFAAAIQDYQRGLVIGDSATHGKGTVQTLHSLKTLIGNKALLKAVNPGSLKITTAKFYRVNGDSTQNKGVQPDIVIPSFRDEMELGESFLPNALAWDSVEPAEIRKSLGLSPFIAKLKERFENRLKNYDWYVSLGEEIRMYGERINKTSLALNLKKRIDAREEKELWSKKISRYKLTKPREYSPGNLDTVIKEALLVMSDLINLQNSVQASSRPANFMDDLDGPDPL